jgi:hypothetical protein
MFRIGGNTFYDWKNKIPMKILEFKRSGIKIIVEFCGIPNGFPNQGVNPLCQKGERDWGADAVSSLPRCLGRQRSASIKVHENNEAKEAAAN